MEKQAYYLELNAAFENSFSRESFETDYQAYLKNYGLFYGYSAMNKLMINEQLNERGIIPSQVGSYTTWKKMNRFVKKGEKGILIFRPIIKKTTTKDKDTDEEITNQYMTGVRKGYIFDLSQTEGDEIIALSEMREINKYQTRMIYNSLAANLPAEIQELDYGGHIIDLPQDASNNIFFKTKQRLEENLFELLVQIGNRFYVNEQPNAAFISQAIALCVMAYLGLETNSCQLQKFIFDVKEFGAKEFAIHQKLIDGKVKSLVNDFGLHQFYC